MRQPWINKVFFSSSSSSSSKAIIIFRFEVNVGEVFTANKKREEREKANSFPLWITFSNFKRFCFWLTFSWNMCGWEARTRTNF